MKLWEVIKELTDDPTKIFEISDRGSRERIGRDGNYLWYGRIDHGMISDSPLLGGSVDINNNNWQIFKQPVTWQEAIQAWADGKTIRLKMPEWEQVWKPTNAISFNYCQITQGSWYVED
jgi:hypothetical protein